MDGRVGRDPSGAGRELLRFECSQPIFGPGARFCLPDGELVQVIGGTERYYTDEGGTPQGEATLYVGNVFDAC